MSFTHVNPTGVIAQNFIGHELTVLHENAHEVAHAIIRAVLPPGIEPTSFALVADVHNQLAQTIENAIANIAYIADIDARCAESLAGFVNQDDTTAGMF